MWLWCLVFKTLTRCFSSPTNLSVERNHKIDFLDLTTVQIGILIELLLAANELKKILVKSFFRWKSFKYIHFVVPISWSDYMNILRMWWTFFGQAYTFFDSLQLIFQVKFRHFFVLGRGEFLNNGEWCSKLNKYNFEPGASDQTFQYFNERW